MMSLDERITIASMATEMGAIIILFPPTPAIIDFCRHAGAAAVHTAVLINKDHQRKARPDLKADYVGLGCIDRYIFGCGMDYKGYWRNAPGIYAVKGM